MQERLFKQIVISLFTSIFIGVNIFGFYQIFLKPSPSCFDKKKNGNETKIDCGGSCVSCEVKTLQPLDYTSTAFFVTQNNKIFIYQKIINANETWGVKSFEYKLSLVSNGQVGQTINDKEYILPLQSKYIVKVIEKPNIKIDSINFEINKDTIEWAQAISKELVNSDVLSVTNVNLSFGSGKTVSTKAVAGNIVYNFNKDLRRGDTGENVASLQAVLAKDQSIYPEGIVNSIFDVNTYKAVIRFQRVNKIVPQTGIVDINTRNVLNQLYGGTVEIKTQASNVMFENNLKFGDKNSDVSELQRVLKNDKSVYPEGFITGKFDYVLKRALERFQEKYELQVTGEFDTPSRTKLNSLNQLANKTNSDVPAGASASLKFSMFNSSSFNFKDVVMIGFLCDSSNSVVAVSRGVMGIKSNKKVDASFSWTNEISKESVVCPGGLNVYTNVFDKNNLIK